MGSAFVRLAAAAAAAMRLINVGTVFMNVVLLPPSKHRVVNS